MTSAQPADHLQSLTFADKMGLCASLSKEDVEKSPEKTVKAKSEEVKDSNGDIVIDIIDDSYLKYGGSYYGDPKDTVDFKYVKFTEIPKLTPAHKSAMAKYLTPEIFEKLKNVESSKGYTLSNAIMTGDLNVVARQIIQDKISHFVTNDYCRRCYTPSRCRCNCWR